jgi:peptidyl-prolyl cis-trans isomerase C
MIPFLKDFLSTGLLMKVFAIALALSVSAFAQVSDEATVVATVNGKKITKAQFEEYHRQNLLFVSQRKINREVSLDDLINRELGIQRARKAGLDTNPVVVSKMEDILYHAQISKDLEDELKKISVTDDEVRKYYANNKEYRTAHILHRLKAQPTPEEVKAALEKSVDIYNQVSKNPDKFATLANQFSQTTNAPVGGDMGYTPPDRLAPEYFEAIKGQKPGFISRPVRTQLGFHIIKVLGVKDYDQINRDVYKRIIYGQKRDAILAKYYADLKKGADIKINKTAL